MIIDWSIGWFARQPAHRLPQYSAPQLRYGVPVAGSRANCAPSGGQLELYFRLFGGIGLAGRGGVSAQNGCN